MRRLEAAFSYIDRFAERWMRELGVPGLAIAVTDRNKLLHVFTHGLADLAAREPVTPSTLFAISSLGKVFTGLSVLQLHEEGRLDLDAPVTDYLPWFSVRSEHAPISVHHLMNHTSGIVRGTDRASHGLYDVWALRETRTSARPGEYFSYSNLGYKAVGFLLEAATGQRFEEIIKHRVLDPLGMTRTHPITTHRTRVEAARGYCGFYDDRPEHRSHALVPALWEENSAGDGCQASTAEDMAIYLRLLLNRGEGPRGRLISERSFRRMTLDGVWTGGDYYGYGLATYPVNGRTYIGHGGGSAGYRSAIVVDLEAGLGVVFLLNRWGETEQIVEAAQHTLSVVEAAHRGEELPAATLPADPFSIENAREYAGTYRSPQRVLELSARGGQLVLEVQGESVALERRAADSFYVAHPDFELFLLDFGREKGKKGSVVEAFHGSDWYTHDRYRGPRSFEIPDHWAAFPGHYRTRSPELSNFRVVLRKGGLALIIGWGTTEPLIPTGDAVFRIGEDPNSPETLQFSAVVEQRTLRADYSGCPYYRTFTA